MLGSQASWDRHAAHVLAVAPVAGTDWEAHAKAVQASLAAAGASVSPDIEEAATASVAAPCQDWLF